MAQLNKVVRKARGQPEPPAVPNAFAATLLGDPAEPDATDRFLMGEAATAPVTEPRRRPGVADLPADALTTRKYAAILNKISAGRENKG